MTWTWQTAMDAKLPTFAGWHFMVVYTTCGVLVRPWADREEKRVTYGNGWRQEEQLDANNPNQRGLSEGFY